MQTLEYHGSEVFLCYTHAPSEAKVSLTENVNINACGGELDGLYTFPLQRTIKDFSAFTLNTMQQKITSAHVELIILSILTYCLLMA